MKDRLKKSSIKVCYESRTSHDCFQIANTCFELALRSEEEWEVQHHCVTGITFSAFSIEAMINHFGNIMFPNWDKQRLKRKDLHKQLFESVNLPGYLGSSTYQQAAECFYLRDNLAHGKTTKARTTVDVPEKLSGDEITYRVVSIKSKPFLDLDIKMLRKYIQTAQQIESDIQDNGFYPGQEDIPLDEREKLNECPLSVTGIRTW